MHRHKWQVEEIQGRDGRIEMVAICTDCLRQADSRRVWEWADLIRFRAEVYKPGFCDFRPVLVNDQLKEYEDFDLVFDAIRRKHADTFTF